MDSNYIGCQVSFPDDLLPDCPSFKTETVQNETIDDNDRNKKGDEDDEDEEEETALKKGNRRKLQRPRRIKNNRSRDTETSFDGEETTSRYAEYETDSENGFTEPKRREDNAKKKRSRQKSLSSSSSEKIPCEVCGRFFAKRYISTHRRSHKTKKYDLNVDELRRSRRKSHETTVDVEQNDSETEKDVHDSTDEDFMKPLRSRKSGKYCCYVCDQSFTKQDMSAHMLTHTETGKLYACYICDEQFTKQEMVSHERTHRKRGTKKKRATNRSSNEKTVENGLESSQINDNDDDGDDNEEEAKEDDDEEEEGVEKRKDDEGDDTKNSKKQRKRFPCDVCGGLYLKSYLPQHRRSHTGEKPFSCEVCDRLFASAISLRVHKKHYHSTDHGKIQCDVCGRLVSSKMSLEQHLLTHSNDKPFQCEVCGKAFKQSSVLSNHLKTHNEGLPYQCEACGRRYKSVQGLILHRRAHHEGIRNLFPCELCEKSFTRRMKLKDHIMWHKGVSPYKCQYCGKRLVSRKTLNTHLLIHEDKKPYECTVCGKAFRQNCVLKRHMSVHTGIKPFSCEHCGKQFIHRVYLVKHTCEVRDGSRTFLAL